MARFEVYKDSAGEYRWRLVSNGETVADSGEGYSSKAACKRAVKTLRELLSGTVVIREVER